MGRSGFYVYFDSKYSALAVMTSEAWTGLMEQTDSFVRPDGESPADYLERTGAAALQTWRAYDSVLIASIQSVPLDDQIAALWASWNTRLTDVLTAQLRRDQERGIARPAGDDVSQLVVTLHYMMQNMFYLDRLQRCDEAQTRRMFNSVKAIWLSSGWGVAPTPQ